LLNNPLASSSTLGTASGAAFGATLAIYFTVILGIPLPKEVFAVGFAILTLLLVIKLAAKKGNYHTTNVVLSGVIVSTILSSAITFIKYLADEDVFVIVSFLMGSLSGKHLGEVLIYGAIMMSVIIVIYMYRTQLNIMMLGRKEALITGVEYDKVFRIMVVLSSVLVALSVTLAGVIGFLGLVVPHIGRMFIGSDNKKSIVVIAFIGAMFLLAADTITRAYLPSQVPVGVITTIIGGSFFIYLYNKKRV
jgi:iron complex transport system permease protein